MSRVGDPFIQRRLTFKLCDLSTITMAVPLAIYLVGVLVVYTVLTAVSHLLSPLRSIPGPFFARFTKLWVFLRMWHGQFEKDNIALHRKYGNIVRYGPHHYSFNDPEAVKVIYGKGTELDKSSWYESWNAPGFKTLFTEPSVKVHGQLRRKFQATYSMSSLVCIPIGTILLMNLFTVFKRECQHRHNTRCRLS